MLFLLDKSAHELARRDAVAAREFETLAVAGLLATCAIVELEILFSARSMDDHRRLKAYLREQCVWLETTEQMLAAAIDLQEKLLGAGLHRKPLPDLILAAVAMAHDAVLVHYDNDFPQIATVVELRQRAIRPLP